MGDRLRLFLGMAAAMVGLAAIILIVQVLIGERTAARLYDEQARSELPRVLKAVAASDDVEDD